MTRQYLRVRSGVRMSKKKTMIALAVAAVVLVAVFAIMVFGRDSAMYRNITVFDSEGSVKVERDGKEVLNVPGILALPGLLASPKMSVLGMVAAPLLGCNIHLENEDGKEVDVAKAVQEAAETVIDTAKTTMKKVEEEMNKAWESVSEDLPEEKPEAEETAANDPAEADAPKETEENPETATDGSIPVKPDDSTQA